MTQITKSEAAVLERIEQQPMLDRTMTWAKINSGTANLEGLAAMAQQLGDAFAELPGEVELVEAEVGVPGHLVKAPELNSGVIGVV